MQPCFTTSERAQDAEPLVQDDARLRDALGVSSDQVDDIDDWVFSAMAWTEKETRRTLSKRTIVDFYSGFTSRLELSGKQKSGQPTMPDALTEIELSYADPTETWKELEGWVLDAPAEPAALVVSPAFPDVSSVLTAPVMATYLFDPQKHLEDREHLERVVLSAMRGLFEQANSIPGSKALDDARMLARQLHEYKVKW